MTKFKKILTAAAVLAFWLSLWQISAAIVGNSYLFPDIPKTFAAFLSLLNRPSFYLALLMSFVRVSLGLIIALVAGCLIAYLSFKFNFIFKLFSPAITVIKSTPVASFIILLWVILGGNALTVTIAFLMVMPIIFQNVYDGFYAIDKDLSELCDVFGFSYFKRLKLLVIPTLMRYLFPALISGVGFAWKAEIAAEIIGYTKNSIGEWINDSKGNYDTAGVFALTLVVIIFSIILEKITRCVLLKLNSRNSVNGTQC